MCIASTYAYQPAKPATATNVVHPNEKNYDSLMAAVINGKPILNFRLRNQDESQSRVKRSVADTINTHLGYQTAAFYHFSGLLEFNNNAIIGNQLYNSGGGTSPNKRQYAVINDPKGTRVDQFYIDYNLFHTEAKLGRQRILLDDERFVGNSGWRQIEQVFDGVTIDNDKIPKFNIFYSYISQVDRVWGPNGVGIFNNNRNNTNLVNLRYTGWEFVNLVAYGYFINNRTVPAFSTNTTGLRFTGSPAINSHFNILYTLEYAHQKDGYNNPVSYSADFSHMGIGIGYKDIATVSLDREKLGGHRSLIGGAFKTPLATLHKFQGWNDLFNTTPNEGVLDTYLSVKSKVTIPVLSDINITAVYHHFNAAAINKLFGNELDLEVGKAINSYFNASVTYANFYHTSNVLRFPPTRNVWLTLKANLL